MAGGGGGRAAASPAGAVGKGGQAEWLRIYDRIVAMLRKSHAQAEELAAERDRLAAFLRIQHEFWASRVDRLQFSLQQGRKVEASRRRCEAANMELLLGDKEREARRYQTVYELTEKDLEDFKTSIVALATENYELKMKLKEVESHTEIVEHVQSPRDLRAEIRKLKNAYKTLSSNRDKEVSALCAERNFAWNQLKTMEKDYIDLLKEKNLEVAQATEAARKLQKNFEELQAQNKDNGKATNLQTTPHGEKVKSCRQHASSAKQIESQSRNNPRRKKVEGEQSETSKKGKRETSQKRKRGSSLSIGGLQRCSARQQAKTPVSQAVQPRCSSSQQAKTPVSQAVQPLLFSPSFRVPKVKNPAPP